MITLESNLERRENVGSSISPAKSVETQCFASNVGTRQRLQPNTRRNSFRLGVLLTAIFVCGLSGFAQNNKQYLDSIVRYNSQKEVFTYDIDGNLTLYIYYTWDNDINDWKKNCKYEYTYNQTLYIYYTWDNDINDWKKNYKYEYTYDKSYSKKDLIIPDNYANNTLFRVNMIRGQIQYLWSDTGWRQDNVATYLLVGQRDGRCRNG